MSMGSRLFAVVLFALVAMSGCGKNQGVDRQPGSTPQALTISTSAPTPTETVTDIQLWPDLDAIRLSHNSYADYPYETTLEIRKATSAKTYHFRWHEVEFSFERQGSKVIETIGLQYIKQIAALDHAQGLWQVTLTDAQPFVAHWVGEPVVYGHEDAGGKYQFADMLVNKPDYLSIELADVSLVAVQTEKVKGRHASVEPKPKVLSGPVTISLKDGKTLQLEQAFLHNFCGVFGGTSVGTYQLAPLKKDVTWVARTIDDEQKVDDQLHSYRSEAPALNPAKVREITFTGGFSEKFRGCRKVQLLYRDGKTKNTNLYRTGESREGVYQPDNPVGQELDTVGGVTKYGRMEVPLGEVRSITYP